MSAADFGITFIEHLVLRITTAVPCTPRADADMPAGLRLWATNHDRLDRLVHFRILTPPVDTNLLFLFGRSDTAMPHFHAQVVQFAPDACVYNADIIPRLDAVEHPGYFQRVYGPVTKAYWQATGNRANACASAPGNPAIAVFLSPWSIAAPRPTSREELVRVTPYIEAYLDQCLALAGQADPEAVSAAALRERDGRHLAALHSDELDPRAWKGVYRAIGEAAGRRAKAILAQPLQP
jgi:hypothetical protein